MGFILTQAGNTLYKVDPTSGTATALTLPTGVTLSTTRKPKFAVVNQWVAMVNSPSRNLAIDPEGNVRVLVPRAPTAAAQLTASGTGLTGTYQNKISFIVKGTDGQLLMESPLSPASPSLTVANQGLLYSQVPISLDTISARRIYRNAASGTQFYKLADLEGNIGTSFLNNFSDASLATLPVVPTVLQSPPGTLEGGFRLRNIASWRNRLWGATDDPSNADTVYYTDDGKVYAWGFTLIAYPTGQDQEGIVAFAPRRDQLGIMKRDGLWQITGTSNSNFSVVQIAFGRGGCVAPDSVVAVNDVVYWLGRDGVYEWGADGGNSLDSITEGVVDPWFTSDTYFNRGRFINAFGRYNQLRDTYDLHLANVGDSTENRWISFNRKTRKWFGPHLTDAFTPSHAGLVFDSNAVPVSLVGATNGIIYTANRTAFTDATSTAIDFDCYGPFHHGDAPDIEHAWLQLSILSKIESGGTLEITPYVGRLNASAGTAISHDLTKGRELLRRLGVGAMARLRMRQNTNAQGCAVYGYELPFIELGRR